MGAILCHRDDKFLEEVILQLVPSTSAQNAEGEPDIPEQHSEGRGAETDDLQNPAKAWGCAEVSCTGEDKSTT
jgi:hypothetical protein